MGPETEAGARVWIRGNKCYRCGHEWKPENIDIIPRVCPKCKSPYWNTPKKEKSCKKVIKIK